jgi:hypothetical protein
VDRLASDLDGKDEYQLEALCRPQYQNLNVSSCRSFRAWREGLEADVIGVTATFAVSPDFQVIARVCVAPLDNTDATAAH